MRVVAGLGNPGGEYEKTRHNIGWMALDALAARLAATRFRREKSVEVAEAASGGEKIFLLKPQTYMNRSGSALAGWLSWNKEIATALRELGDERKSSPPSTEQSAAQNAQPNKNKQDAADDAACRWPGLLVVADDVNLALGRLRFRPAGSAGGHNGLADIAAALGGQGYPRLRLGVGEPPERMDRADYVLGKFSPDEAPVVEKVAAVAAEAVAEWIQCGMDAARGKYNGARVGGG